MLEQARESEHETSDRLLIWLATCADGRRFCLYYNPFSRIILTFELQHVTTSMLCVLQRLRVYVLSRFFLFCNDVFETREGGR